VHDNGPLPPVNLQICDPNRPSTSVLMGSGRHRWEFMLKPGETPAQATDEAFIVPLLAALKARDAVTLERTVVDCFKCQGHEKLADGSNHARG